MRPCAPWDTNANTSRAPSAEPTRACCMSLGGEVPLADHVPHRKTEENDLLTALPTTKATPP